jgi:hypothetical protein
MGVPTAIQEALPLVLANLSGMLAAPFRQVTKISEVRATPQPR